MGAVTGEFQADPPGTPGTSFFRMSDDPHKMGYLALKTHLISEHGISKVDVDRCLTKKQMLDLLHSRSPQEAPASQASSSQKGLVTHPDAPKSSLLNCQGSTQALQLGVTDPSAAFQVTSNVTDNTQTAESDQSSSCNIAEITATVGWSFEIIRNEYKTEAEARVALAGGRTADDKTVCFCLMWDVKGVDLDIHCETPSGQTCYFPKKCRHVGNCSLDVDRMGSHFPNQVENIFLDTPGAADGKYRYFVRYYLTRRQAEDLSGMPATINFKFTLNQFGKTVHEGVGIVTKERKDTTCVELTMKDNKVVEVDFGASVTVEERA